MSSDQLLQYFDQISEAPDAVPQLRGTILDLAVRGTLVAQDPEDEPAAELLKQIGAEKERLIKEGKIRRQTALPPIGEDEIPFKLPTTWRWARLVDLLTKLTDGTHYSPPNIEAGDFKYITAKNIKPEGVSLDEITFVTKDVHAEIFARCDPVKGDVLYIKDGATTGIVTVNDLDEPFSMLSSVALLKLPQGVYNRLLVFFLRSPFFYSQMRGFMKGAAITRVTLKRMAPALIPLPPLAEQHRIVAKVDELMGLCDELEAAQAKRERRRDRLVAATLHGLNNGDASADPGTRPAFQDSARFYFNHLPRLTTRPEHIHQLRQTILNLAVRGKLVPQNPKDEGVCALVERIAAEQRRSATLERLKRRAAAHGPQDLEPPYALPIEWRWLRLGELVTFGPQNGISPKPTASETAPKALTLTATTSGFFDPAHYKHVDLREADCKNYWLAKGDVLFQRGNTRAYVGMAAVFDGPERSFVFPDLMIRVRLSDALDLRFVHTALISPPLRAYFSAAATGASSSMPKISQGVLLDAPIPLPPLAEQHRIVAKVDELMALCDELGSRLATTATARRQLLEAALQEVR